MKGEGTSGSLSMRMVGSKNSTGKGIEVNSLGLGAVG